MQKMNEWIIGHKDQLEAWAALLAIVGAAYYSAVSAYKLSVILIKWLKGRIRVTSEEILRAVLNISMAASFVGLYFVLDRLFSSYPLLSYQNLIFIYIVILCGIFVPPYLLVKQRKRRLKEKAKENIPLPIDPDTTLNAPRQERQPISPQPPDKTVPTDPLEALRIGLYRDHATVVPEEEHKGITLQNYPTNYHVLSNGRWDASGSPKGNVNEAYPIDLKRHRVISLNANVTSTSAAFNFAVKLMNQHGKPLDNGVFCPKDEIAFAFRHRPHWDYVHASIHFHRHKIVKEVKLPINTQFDLDITVRQYLQKPIVQVKLNNTNVFLHRIVDDLRWQLALIAWADGAPFDISFQQINVRTQPSS